MKLIGELSLSESWETKFQKIICWFPKLWQSSHRIPMPSTLPPLTKKTTPSTKNHLWCHWILCMLFIMIKKINCLCEQISMFIRIIFLIVNWMSAFCLEKTHITSLFSCSVRSDTTAQGAGIQMESSSLAELRRWTLGFRSPRCLEFSRRSTGRRELFRERGPEIFMRPLETCWIWFASAWVETPQGQIKTTFQRRSYYLGLWDKWRHRSGNFVPSNWIQVKRPGAFSRHPSKGIT